MRAIHKYNKNSKEGARRIAQSFGYKMSIHDMPHMIALCQRAGIFEKDVERLDYNYKPDTQTLEL